VSTLTLAQSLGGMKVTTIHLEGTFQTGMAMGASVPKEDYGMLGAIVEGPRGSVFFKMTGPKETVRTAAPGFDDLALSFKANVEM